MTQKGLAPLLIVIIFAGVIALAGGAYYLGTKRSETFTTPSQQPQQTTADVSPAPTDADETVYTESDRSANWKTYTNSQHGYSLKYPEDKFLLEEYNHSQVTNDSELSFVPLTYCPSKKPDDCGYNSGFYVRVYNNTQNWSLDQWIDSSVNSPKSPERDSCFGKDPRERFVKTTFLDKESFEQNVKVDDEYIKNCKALGATFGGDKKIIFVPLRSNIIEIAVEYYSDDKDGRTLLNKILSTFKFLK